MITSVNKTKNTSEELHGRAGASWPAEEDLQLYLETKRGLSVKTIAHEHGRTSGAIRARQLRLGLRDKHSNQLIEPLPDFQLIGGPKTRIHRYEGEAAVFEASPHPDRNKSRRWTPEEDQQLYNETASGIQVSVIATKHRRTELAIRKRQARLRLRKNRSNPLFDPLPEYHPVQPGRRKRDKEPEPLSSTTGQESVSLPGQVHIPTPGPLVAQSEDILPESEGEPVALLWVAIWTDIERLAKSDGAAVFDPRSKVVLRSRLSPGDTFHPFRTLEDLGGEFGISRERVRQLERTGVRKLNRAARRSTSMFAATLRSIVSAEGREDLEEQTRWLVQEMLSAQCGSHFRIFVIESFFKLTNYPEKRRKEILAALPYTVRQLRQEERRAARAEANHERTRETRQQADAFVLGVLGKAVYGGNHLAEFTDLVGFAPLRNCQGGRTEFSQTLQRVINVESYGEVRFIRALDACGVIDAFAEQAIGIPYEINGSSHLYIPDLLLRTVEGFAFVIEVKARLRIADLLVQHKARAAEAYLGERGIGYCLVDADGTSAEDLRGIPADEELRTLVWKHLSRSGVFHLRDLRNHLGIWPGDEIIDRLQSLVLREGLDYRTRFFPHERSPTGYGFDFELRAPTAT